MNISKGQFISAVKKTEILKLDKEKQLKKILRQATEVIKKGGVVAFPTETVYALGADAMNKNAVKKIFRLKKREADKQIALFLLKPEELNKFVKDVTSPAKRLMNNFWPGPLTLIFKSKAGKFSHLIGKEEKIGIRVSSSKIVQSLLRQTRTPLTATSANLSGLKGSFSADEVLKDFDGKIELILDGGSSEKIVPSSVVDVSGDIPSLIREGCISFAEIKRVTPELQRK
ncbi:MAG: L-threonylcarbamoyladenylate synthase [candidate division Zixibacteria bacterium]|nr:L-threonylcarbamoyladenylate synthase [candidate division Zixibacteria bacterium]